MITVDSSGWLEFFASGPLKDKFRKYLVNPSDILTPTIIVYEVYKKIKREVGEEEALFAAGQLQKTNIVPLSESISYTAAEMSLEHGLPMADAIIYATAYEHECKVVTSDKHFKGLDGVIFIDGAKK